MPLLPVEEFIVRSLLVSVKFVIAKKVHEPIDES